MKWYINIIVISVVWAQSTCAQTYFNERYAPSPNIIGQGATHILPVGNNYITTQAEVTHTGIYTSTLNFIDSLGNFSHVTDSLGFLDRNLQSGGLIRAWSGYAQGHRFIYFGGNQTYGFSLYDSLGQTVLFYEDTTEYHRVTILNVYPQESDSTLVLIGYLYELNNPNAGGETILIAKHHLNGQLIWRKKHKIGGKGYLAFNAKITPDNGFVIAGAERNVVTQIFKPLVMKVDSFGNMQWHRVYGNNTVDNMGANAITTTQDGGYAFVGALGTAKVHVAHYHVPWIVKIDSLGNVLWEDVINAQDAEIISNQYNDIVELSNGALVVCGERMFYEAEQTTQGKYRMRGVINKWSANGTLLWARKYHHPDAINTSATDNILYDIAITPDSGFVACGHLAFSTDNTQDAWVLKVDSLGCEQPCAVNAINAPSATKAEQWQVYPNPASKFVQIQFNGVQLPNTTYNLYNLSGQQVLQTSIHSLHQQIAIGHLPPGMYVYKLGNQTGKLVVR